MRATLRNMTSVYIFKDDRVLLLYRQGGRVVNNVWTGSAGGHFEDCELNNPESCILREMKEELGIDRSSLERLQLRYVTLRNVDGEIRQNYYYFAELSKEYSDVITSNEGIAKWFSVDEISNLKMPYTARFVIEHYLAIGKSSQDTFVGVADGHTVQFVMMPIYK